jgi:hypothetical protein
MIRKKLPRNNKRRKKTEADLATFKLIINNTGQFIVEQSLYPKDKINLHFRKENAGLISAMLRESKIKFDNIKDIYEILLKELS